MDDILSIQLPEEAQSEDTRSESIDCEDVMTEGNTDIYLSKSEDTSALAHDKTDEEKLVQSSDNLLSISVNSPKTTLLGKLKAKQRLQAFLLPKQNLVSNSFIKKIEDNQNFTKTDKATKKLKKNPINKTKSLIEEIEEIKKIEIARILSPALFKERRSSYREKQYRHKSRSRSSEKEVRVRKVPEKGKYPASWEEVKERQLSLGDVFQIKLNTYSRNIKHQDHCDFRKQLLFQLPAQTLAPLKVKTVNGVNKTIPPQYLRFTKKSPAISYSISHHKYGSDYFIASEIYECIPKPHIEIISKFKADKCKKFTDDVSEISTRKWYPKQALGNITEGCELLQKSLGLSILQNYMDEEEEEEKNFDTSKPVECNIDCNNKEPEHFTSEVNLTRQSTDISTNQNIQKEMNDVESKHDNSEFITKMRKKSKDKKYKSLKHKREKNDKDTRKRKRKKTQKERAFRKKKVNKYQDDKNVTKERKEKIKKNKNRKEESKIDIDQRTKSNKENKKDVATHGPERRENSTEIKREQVCDGKHNKWDLKETYDWKEFKKSEIKREQACDGKINKSDLKETYDWKECKKTEIKREQAGDGKISKWDLKETYDWKEFKKSDHEGDKKDDEKLLKRHKKPRRRGNISSMESYYDEFDALKEGSPSSEKIECIRKETGQKSQDSSQERKGKGSKEDSKKLIEKRESRKPLKTDVNKEKKTNIDNSEKDNLKLSENLKQEISFKIEPLKSEEGLGTPDTDEYHSHWESDEDVSDVVSYSPLVPRKLNTSWESDEDMLCSDKHLANDRYVDQSLRKSREKSLERRSKKYLEGERSLEMPLNIMNVSRKEPRKPNKPLNVSDRKLLNNEPRPFDEDSWERGEFLKIRNDIEGEKLKHERETLSEERRLLEIEKRKLAEKLEKRSFQRDVFDDFEKNVAKEISYEKIHSGEEGGYVKSTDYICDTNDSRADNHDKKKRAKYSSRKRTHSIEDDRKRSDDDHRKRSGDDHRSHNRSDPKKFRCDKLENYKYESSNEAFISLIEDKSTASENVTSGVCESNEILGVKHENVYIEHQSNKWNAEQKGKCCTNDKPDFFPVPDVSDSLISACDSLTSDTRNTNKSDILENEYEEFLKAVTTDISNEGDISQKRKTTRKKQEIKKAKLRKRKYSTSSSSSSSDSYDSDSTSSSSSTSSYSSSVSSTSSDEKEKKRRKMKAKQKKLKDKESIVKIEMTHSIVKDLDDLQPYPVSNTPTIQIKQEEEEFTCAEILSSASFEFMNLEKDVIVPLPVPSPAIVPPPYINLLSIKQEKTDDSVSSKADSTTSPTKRVPLIPTKFIAPSPRKEIKVTTATSIILDTSKNDESDLNKVNSAEVVESSQNTNNSVLSSLPSRRAVLNENVNDSDSPDFTDYFKKKSEKFNDNDCDQINASNTTIKDTKPTIEAGRICVVEEDVQEIPFSSLNKSEKVEETTNAASSIDKEPNTWDIELPPSPRRNVTSCSHNDISLKPKIEPRKQSPPRNKRKSYSETTRRSPRRSTSPKYRNVSPRRVSPPRRRRSRDLSPTYRRSSHCHDDLRRGSPRRKRSSDRYDNRKTPTHSFRNRRSPSPRRRSSVSPRNRSLSPRIRRSLSPRIGKSSPRNRKSSFNRSPCRRSSPSDTRRRSYSRSVSPERKKESFQQTLQRLAGMDDHYHQAINKSPINSPVDGFKRSVADSTISDDQLLQQNSAESIESPFTTSSIKLVHPPHSPKRVPLDVRINQVLGLNKDQVPATTTYTQATYAQSYTYDQYSEHYPQYDHSTMHRDGYVHPPPQLPKSQSHVGTSKVVQIGNMLQVVPTEEILPQEHVRPPPPQKIVQVGNMLQIVPSPTTHIPHEIMTAPSTNATEGVQADISLQVLQSGLSTSQSPQPTSDHNTASTPIHEKVSPEDIMLQKIAERRAERTKRHEERERKRIDKEKRRKEKEKKKQLRFKMKTENMIKKALRIETEALAMGENLDDEENDADATPSCWPSINVTSTTPLKLASKGILIRHGFSKLTVDDDGDNRKHKCVKFADGITPGEGTSPSGGEELSSPPPPKEKRFKKIKKKKSQKKKKIKVKIIRKSLTESPDDEELDNLPPPSPPPGSPPSHIFPARIKSHTINNIHPTYATGVPLMTVSNYAPQFRPNIPITVPPPVHNVPHSAHHGPSPPRPSPQIVPQHGPSLQHGPILHGVSPGLAHGMSPHPHASLHHPAGLR